MNRLIVLQQLIHFGRHVSRQDFCGSTCLRQCTLSTSKSDTLNSKVSILATKQPFSGTALFSWNEEAERNRSLKNARSVSHLLAHGVYWISRQRSNTTEVTTCFMECTNSARQRRTAWMENRHRRSGTPSVQRRHCSSPRNTTSWRMSTGGGRGRLQVLLHQTPRRLAKSSWCRLNCNQNDIAVRYGVTAAWYFAIYHHDAPSA